MLQHSILKIVLAGLVSILFSSFALLTHAAGILYAKPTATGAGDCSSWANACGLQTALTGATSGDEIWVAAGTYKPTTGITRSATFQLKSGVGVYGGFLGAESTREQRHWTTNVTTLSGDIGTIGAATDNVWHVVTASGTDSTAVLDGFTITGGYAKFGTLLEAGGGLYNESGSPTLANLIFVSNYAWGNGGGMFTSGGNPTLTNVVFDSNRISNGYAGGLYTDNGTPSLTDVTFYSNTGGGMANWNGNSTLVNVTFGNNWNFGPGGGLGIFNSSPTLVNVTFYSNTTSTVGGAVYSSRSSPTLTHVTFFSNTAATAASGGAIHAYNVNVGTQYTVTVQNSILWTGSPTLVAKSGAGTTAISITHSVVQNGCPSGTTCANLITMNPNLGSLGNNGGNTQTLLLLAGSSAIDAVPTGTHGCGTTITTDQRAVIRPQGSACDAGAFEAQGGGGWNIYLPLVVRQ